MMPWKQVRKFQMASLDHQHGLVKYFKNGSWNMLVPSAPMILLIRMRTCLLKALIGMRFHKMTKLKTLLTSCCFFFYSLSATYLRNRILGALRKSFDPEAKEAAPHIPPNVIFENPTIQLLSSRIAALVNDNGAGQGVDFIEQHKQAINAMIEKYSVGLDGPVDGVLPSSQLVEPAVVLLTGSTGGLGSFLLSELLTSPVVQHVFAFNRPSSTKSIEERQKAAFRDRGLQVDLLESNKLVYIEADASLEKCGLSPAQYEEVGLTFDIVEDTISDISSADPEFRDVDHTQRVAPRFQLGDIFL
jgi:hypothetical protein